MNIKSPADFGRALKAGAYAWPGGYPTYFVTSDGACLCHQCASTHAKDITTSIRDQLRDGWQVEAIDVNWEDPSLYCEGCSDRIESAHAEDEHKAICSGQRR